MKKKKMEWKMNGMDWPIVTAESGYKLQRHVVATQQYIYDRREILRHEHNHNHNNINAQVGGGTRNEVTDDAQSNTY